MTFSAPLAGSARGGGAIRFVTPLAEGRAMGSRYMLEQGLSWCRFIFSTSVVRLSWSNLAALFFTQLALWRD